MVGDKVTLLFSACALAMSGCGQNAGNKTEIVEQTTPTIDPAYTAALTCYHAFGFAVTSERFRTDPEAVEKLKALKQEAFESASRLESGAKVLSDELNLINGDNFSDPATAQQRMKEATECASKRRETLRS